MQIDRSHAPGCYGSGFLYVATSAECRPCQFREACGPEAADRRQAIFAAHGVDDPELTRKAPRLNDKAAAIVAETDAEAALVALRAGRNPFKAVRFVAVAAHLLIKVDRPIERDTFKVALMRALEWSKSTAETHARTAIQVLVALGAAEVAEGKIRRTW